MYGLSPGSFPGTQAAWEELVHPEDRGEAVRGVERAMTEGAFEEEWRVIWPDGSVHWLLGRAWVFRSQEGEPERLIGVNIDVTDSKRIEAALHESERRFREMFDLLPVAIYITDAEGRLTYFNPAAIRFSGREPELGTDRWCVSWKLFHADGTLMRHDECPMALVLKQGLRCRWCRGYCRAARRRSVSGSSYPRPLHDAQARIIGGINMLMDITEPGSRLSRPPACSLPSSIPPEDAIVSKDSPKGRSQVGIRVHSGYSATRRKKPLGKTLLLLFRRIGGMKK